MIKNRIKEIILINHFFKQNPGVFSEEEEQIILNYAKNPRKADEIVPEMIRELYDALGWIKKEENIYDGFLDMIEEEHKLEEKKIVEVGGGHIPVLGKRIEKKLTAGKIVIYDPLLSLYEKNTDKMILVRDLFRSSTDVSGIDLLIGLMPCQGARDLIDSALENNIDFIVALCEGGPHGEDIDEFDNEEDWQRSLISYALRGVAEKEMGILKMKSLRKYGIEYPVIYNARK